MYCVIIEDWRLGINKSRPGYEAASVCMPMHKNPTFSAGGRAIYVLAFSVLLDIHITLLDIISEGLRTRVE